MQNEPKEAQKANYKVIVIIQIRHYVGYIKSARWEASLSGDDTVQMF